jgi:hypothetical protein
MPVNTPALSGDTTVFSNISLNDVAGGNLATAGAITSSRLSSSASILGTNVWASTLSASNVTMPGGFMAAANTAGGLSLGTYSFSILTAAAATSIPDNHLGLVFRASGISLVYLSGGTVYSFGTNGVGASFTSGTA